MDVESIERTGGFISKKRVLSGLLILILISQSIFANPKLVSAKSNYKYAKTTVNIRAKPNTKSKIVGKGMIKCKLLEKSIKNGTWLGIKRRIGMYVLSI